MKIAKVFIFIAILSLSLSAVADETYISTVEGTFAASYDGDAAGTIPDPTGYGNFLCGNGGYLLTLNYPDPIEGYFDWYLNPNIYVAGLLLNQVPMDLYINADGIAFWFMNELAYTASWAELGFTWVPGMGLYAGEYATPDGIWPPDPDAIVGNWYYDYDGGGDDVYVGIQGADGVHNFDFCFFRSITWLANTGTAIPNDLADWLEANIGGMDATWVRAVDLTFLELVDTTIVDFGGPAYGAPDAITEGYFMVTLTAHRGSTAVEESSWSQLKTLY